MGLSRIPRAITIDDVADRAGVSAKTVSRVLNNEPNVRATKREIVMKAARDLGYRPNPAARSLAGAKSFLLAHLHDNPVPEYVSAVNTGIYEACRAQGYFLLPEPVDRSRPDFLDRLQQFLMTSRADSVVLSPPLCDDERVISLLEDTETDYASLSPSEAREGVATVRMDDRLAAKDIVKHLISLGHTRIALISGPESGNAAAGRRHGYVDALSEAGLEIDHHAIITGDYSLRSGLEAARFLLARPKPPTAIFAANDDMAVGAMTAIMAAGLSIPKDISVAGFDDTRLASAVWPALTTIRQPVAEMAKRAAERLMASDDGDASDDVFQFELVVRQSTGPAT